MHKQKHAFIHLIIALSLPAVFLFTACSSGEQLAADETVSPGRDSEVFTEDQITEARSNFIRGISARHLDDYEAAEVLLTRAQNILHQSSGVNFALAELYFEMSDYVNSIYYGNRAVELDPHNKWYRLQLVDGYRATGNNRKGVEQLQIILEQNPSDIDVLYQKARILSGMGEYAKSNEAYQQILDLTGPDRAIIYQRINNYTRLDDNDAIINELKKVLELDPGNINTLLMLNQFYLEQDRIEDAREVLEQARQRNPRHPETLVNLADIHINQDEWEEAGALLQNLVGDTLVSPGNKLEIVQYIISRYSNNPGNEQLHKTTSSLIGTLLETEPDNGLAHSLAAEFYIMTEDGDQALHHLQITTEIMPENDAAWRQLIQTYYIEGRYEDAIAAGEKADNHVPEDAFIMFFTGGSYFLKENYEKAVKWLQSASELPSRSEFRSIILGTLGDTYASLDQWDEADKAYEAALAHNSDNDVALNNYAYYLSEREENLEKAKEMANRALELNPANSAFLDTMGWIYFKLGDYEKAHEYIKASLETGDASAEVMEHMGDVYDKMGEPDRALYWWQKALEEDESRTHLKERLHIN